MNMTDMFLDNQYGLCTADTGTVQFLEGKLSFSQWQSQLRKALYTLLGRFPSAGKMVSHYDQGAEEPVPGGTRKKIAYYAEEFLDTPAYILTPEDVSPVAPVILCLHGHGVGCRDIVGLGPNESYEKDFALTVCAHGMIAFAPELCGFGELRLEEDAAKLAEDSSCHRLSMGLLACGRTMAGVRLHQCLRALDLIGELYPGHPIGVMGISGGGLVASLLSALDDRIAACVISGYANYFRDSILAMHHCVDNYLPGMLERMEMPDLLAAVAPRPMLWETGSEDPIFPQEATLRAENAVRKSYDKLDAGSTSRCAHLPAGTG